MKFRHLCALTSVFFTNIVLGSQVPIGIIGGQGDAPYAALVQSDGSVMTLQGLPDTGLTFRVGINPTGHGIIGGTDGVNAYSALVSPNGVLTPIPGLLAPGEIYTVAINKSGSAIVGGGHLTSNIPYAALVAPNGVATSLSLPASGLVYSVAIDSSGESFIGGVGPLHSAYAAIVSQNGAVTPITGLPANGSIFWVAVSDSKLKFIGGQENSSVYAAFVGANGSLTRITGLPLGLNYSVGMNAKGAAIMGGTSLTLPYAALVSSTGVVNTLQGLPKTAGIIYNVAINDAGSGLIAGFSTTGPYGSFVAPNGSLTPLKGLPEGPGFLDGIALHATGIGLVGGETHGTRFAALAAPNGTLTYLGGIPLMGAVNSTAIAMLDNLVPKSIGPFDSIANTQFSLSEALTQHCLFHGKNDACSCNFENTTFWLSLFGNYVHEKKQHALPAFSNNIYGALLGLDYKAIPDVVIGGALSYAYNHAHYSKHLGHTDINQESAVLYATWNHPCFYINASLWGGVFQSTHKRKSLGFITSKSNPSGWNISSHLELSTPILIAGCPKLRVDPFVAFDWMNNWQHHFKEQGSSGFNIALKDQYLSIFRSEVGLRFYETFECEWGCFILEEKISYVNRAPLCKGHRRTYFIGSASSFNVETLSTNAKNLGNIQIHLECLPTAYKNIYASFDYQGGFGKAYQSHMLTFSMGKDF